jgi:hypothetical protein
MRSGGAASWFVQRLHARRHLAAGWCHSSASGNRASIPNDVEKRGVLTRIRPGTEFPGQRSPDAPGTEPAGQSPRPAVNAGSQDPTRTRGVPEVHPESPPLLGTLTRALYLPPLQATRPSDSRSQGRDTGFKPVGTTREGDRSEVLPAKRQSRAGSFSSRICPAADPDPLRL